MVAYLSEESNVRIGLFLTTGVVTALALGLFFFTSPYSEDWLPVWVEKGNLIVYALEKYRTTHGLYPLEFPANFYPEDFPGLQKIQYVATVDEEGQQFFKLIIYIHLREAVIYDSRQDPRLFENWGFRKVLGGWLYTRG